MHSLKQFPIKAVLQGPVQFQCQLHWIGEKKVAGRGAAARRQQECCPAYSSPALHRLAPTTASTPHTQFRSPPDRPRSVLPASLPHSGAGRAREHRLLSARPSHGPHPACTPACFKSSSYSPQQCDSLAALWRAAQPWTSVVPRCGHYPGKSRN
jgi:hypothetical protein